MGRKSKEFNADKWPSIHEISIDTYNAYYCKRMDITEIKPSGNRVLFWVYEGKCYIMNTYKVIRKRYFTFHLEDDRNNSRRSTLKVEKQKYGMTWFVLYNEY